MEILDTEVSENKFKEELEKQYIFFVNSFSILAIGALLTFAFVNVAAHNLFLGVIEFSVGVILIINLIFLWITENTRLCTFVLVAGVYALLMLLLFTGGIANTGIFWFFTFPPAVFFLTGKKSAVIWLLFLYISIIAATVLGERHYLELAYSSIQIRQFIVAHLVVSVTLFIYENTRVRFENELENNRKALEKKLQEDRK